MAGLVELTGQRVQGRVLPRRALDGAGGLALRAPLATFVRLSREGLRCLDLIDSPQLEVLDLSRLRGVVHLTVRGCPALQQILLPNRGAAHVHLDTGDQSPRWLQITGGVEQFDACWGQEGRLLRRVPARTAPWKAVLVVTGPAPQPDALAAPAFKGGLLVWIATDAMPHQELASPGAAVDSVCVTHTSAQLLALDWLGTRPLREFTVENSTHLMTLRLRTPVDHLGLSHCDRLRVVTSEGQPCRQVSVRECGSRLDDSNVRPDRGHGPRLRSFLMLDVPSDTVTLVDTQLQRLCLPQPCSDRLEVIRCAALRLMRLPPHTRVRCLGHLPLCVMDHLVGELLTVEVDESFLRAIARQVIERHPLGWKRLQRALGWCQSPRSISTALQILAHAVAPVVPPADLWNARTELLRGQRNGAALTRWVWNTSTDLAAQAYRDDFMLYERCRSAYRNRAFIRSATMEMMRHDGEQQTAALLPWLAKEAHRGSGARLIGLEAVLRHASFEQHVPAHVKAGLRQSLPFLLYQLEPGSSVRVVSQATFFDAARSYYARHGTPEELQAWLGLELKRGRVQAQVEIARLLAEAPLNWEEGLDPQRRASLTSLMLTGRAPVTSVLPQPSAAA